MAGRVCSVDGCERKMAARGWCGTHYERSRVTCGLTTRQVAEAAGMSWSQVARIAKAAK